MVTPNNTLMGPELKKIELETTPATMIKERKQFPWKLFFFPLGVVVLVMVILGIMLLPMRDVVRQARVVAAKAKDTGAALKSQDLVKTKEGLAETRKELVILSAQYNKVKPLRVIPFLGLYVQDGQHALNAALAGRDAGDKAIEALEPNADILGLKGKSTFVSGTADDRIQTAVKTMTALTPKINEMATHIETLRGEINAIDADRYPVTFQKVKVREQ